MAPAEDTVKVAQLDHDQNNDRSMLGEEGEEEEEFEDDAEVDLANQEGQLEDRDKLIHWWCHRQLSRALRRLTKHPQAGAFLEPLPWKELGLDDYPEVITEPVDLKTIGECLNNSEYEDPDGLLNPEFFWQDIKLCWENCLIYYERDMEIEACKMAEAMRLESEQLEETFWQELTMFETSLDRAGLATLHSVRAVADEAVAALEDAAALAYEDTSKLIRSAASWWWGGGENPSEQEKKGPADVGSSGRRPALRQHFLDIFEHRFKFDANEELKEIDEEVVNGMSSYWPSIPEDSNLGDMIIDESIFTGSDKKLPIEKLVPVKKPAPASAMRLLNALGNAAKKKGSVSSERNSTAESQSRRASSSLASISSRAGAAAKLQGCTSSICSDAGHRSSGRSGSPARSECSGGSVASRRSGASAVSRRSRAAASEAGSAGSRAKCSPASDRATARALRKVQAAVGEVPGIESSEEEGSGDKKQAAVSVTSLQNIFSKKAHK